MPTRPTINSRHFLIDQMTSEQRCLPLSLTHTYVHPWMCIHVHKHPHSPCLSVTPKVSTNEPSAATSHSVLTAPHLHWHLPGSSLPTPTSLRKPGPRAWGRAHLEQVDAVLPEVEQEGGGVTGAGGGPGSLHPCLHRGIKQPVRARDSHSLNLHTE
jgi:hypothetical protein